MKKNKVENVAVAAAPVAAAPVAAAPVAAAPVAAAPVAAAPVAAAIVSARFDGFEVSAESIAKIERDWQSACGRISSAVDKAAEEIDLGGSIAKHKSGIQSGKDGTRRKAAIVAATPAAVDRAAKYLTEAKLLGERDAELWRNYVRLALAFECMRAIGRL